jgi:predicted metalloprotease with PDZ domain
MVADELIGVDGERISTVEQWNAALSDCHPLTVLLARRGQLRETTLLCSPSQLERLHLQTVANMAPEVLGRRQAWEALRPC